jgi:hypothetical protein
MSSLAHTPAAFEIRTLGRHRTRSTRMTGLRLLPTGDGWSLVGPAGELVFHALGPRGRRQCLEYARARGVLFVSS